MARIDPDDTLATALAAMRRWNASLPDDTMVDEASGLSVAQVRVVLEYVEAIVQVPRMVGK